MNNIFKLIPKTATFSLIPRYNYHFPKAGFGDTHHNVFKIKKNIIKLFQPGITAKRVIKCVGERLRTFDPQRWDSVPVTFKTSFRDGQGYADIATCMHIHDALEKEFGCDIKDR